MTLTPTPTGGFSWASLRDMDRVLRRVVTEGPASPSVDTPRRAAFLRLVPGRPCGCGGCGPLSRAPLVLRVRRRPAVRGGEGDEEWLVAGGRLPSEATAPSFRSREDLRRWGTGSMAGYGMGWDEMEWNAILRLLVRRFDPAVCPMVGMGRCLDGWMDAFAVWYPVCASRVAGLVVDRGVCASNCER